MKPKTLTSRANCNKKVFMEKKKTNAFKAYVLYQQIETRLIAVQSREKNKGKNQQQQRKKK